MTRAFTLAIMLVAPLTCAGAPLCWESMGVPPQCLYSDPRTCAQEVERSGGVCSTNSAEVRTPTGPGNFCVIQSSLVSSCAYADRQSCQLAAVRAGGACVQADQPAEAQANVDPFRTRRPY